MWPIGIDLGNGAVKVRTDHLKLLIPNVMAVGATRADLLENTKALDTLDVTLSSSLIGDSQRYFVGSLASYQGTRAKYMSPNEQKTNSLQSSVLFVTSLAAAVLHQKTERGESIPEKIEMDLFAVTGVSLVESLQKGVRKRFESSLNGTHRVKFEPPSPWGGVEVVLNVQTKVFPEGYAAFLWMAGNAQSIQQARDAVIGMAEIGELSTEFPVFQGVNLNPSLCTGEQFGVGGVMDELLIDIRELTGVESAFSNGRLELEQFLESPRWTCWLMGTEYDLTQVIQERLSKEAKRLYDLILAKWKRTPSIQQFWVVGGGSALFQPYLKVLAAKDNRMLFFASSEMARWMNAEGMYMLAKEAAKRHAESVSMNHA
ncbi:ParM/StbA family protein [Alicyclobacillus tolerans]|uniref:ParM/StbA family protein n=1 Tax=Alicyclobacillus tolerans TaxID=90970 RepID=UPI001F16775A|nr:ParM/StbA family protein [Alicyclobacillus tolerans]MCF8568240.1 ParM/StbA family protein [Alicyclobacillus tolerans]